MWITTNYLHSFVWEFVEIHATAAHSHYISIFFAVEYWYYSDLVFLKNHNLVEMRKREMKTEGKRGRKERRKKRREKGGKRENSREKHCGKWWKWTVEAPYDSKLVNIKWSFKYQSAWHTRDVLLFQRTSKQSMPISYSKGILNGHPHSHVIQSIYLRNYTDIRACLA